MSYEKAGKFTRSAGIEKNKLTTGELNYLVEVLRAELVAVDGNKVVIGMHGKVNNVHIPASGGGVKSLSREMPGQYGYPKVSEAGDMSYFGSYIEAGNLGGYEENPKWSGLHLWTEFETKYLMVSCKLITDFMDDCTCSDCSTSRRCMMLEWCRIANTSPDMIPLHPVSVHYDSDDDDTVMVVQDFSSEENLFTIDYHDWLIMTCYEKLAAVSDVLREFHGVYGTWANPYTFKDDPIHPITRVGSSRLQRVLADFMSPQQIAETITAIFEQDRQSELEAFINGCHPIVMPTRIGMVYYDDWIRLTPYNKRNFAMMLKEDSRGQKIPGADKTTRISKSFPDLYTQ